MPGSLRIRADAAVLFFRSLEPDLQHDLGRAVIEREVVEHGFPVDGVGVRGMDVHAQHVLAPGGQGHPLAAHLENDIPAVGVPEIIGALFGVEGGLLEAQGLPGLGFLQLEIEAIDVRGHVGHVDGRHGIAAAAVGIAGLEHGKTGRDREVDARGGQGFGPAAEKTLQGLGRIVGLGPGRRPAGQKEQHEEQQAGPRRPQSDTREKNIHVRPPRPRRRSGAWSRNAIKGVPTRIAFTLALP